MPPTFDNLKDMEKYLKNVAKEAMSKGSKVKDLVIETGKRHVQEDVYDVYSPKVYERSGELKENWKVEEIADGIEVYNDRQENGKSLAYTVEYGRNYDYEFEYAHSPRPFIENTRQELANGNKLTNAMKQDLQRLGLDVE